MVASDLDQVAAAAELGAMGGETLVIGVASSSARYMTLTK